MLFAELLAQLLRPVYGQAVVCPVPWVKADDIVVAFHIFPFLVFLIVEIGSHTGNSEILAPTVEGRNVVVLPRYQPPVFIKGGLHGKLVMLKCEVGFRCAIVGIFRADMFECCQQRHPLSVRLQTLGQQGRKPPPVLPRQAADRDCATRSASGLSGSKKLPDCRSFPTATFSGNRNQLFYKRLRAGILPLTPYNTAKSKNDGLSGKNFSSGSVFPDNKAFWKLCFARCLKKTAIFFGFTV